MRHRSAAAARTRAGSCSLAPRPAAAQSDAGACAPVKPWSAHAHACLCVFLCVPVCLRRNEIAADASLACVCERARGRAGESEESSLFRFDALTPALAFLPHSPSPPPPPAPPLSHTHDHAHAHARRKHPWFIAADPANQPDAPPP